MISYRRFTAVVVAVLVVLLSGCKTATRVQYVPVESVKRDSVYITRYQDRVLHERDSVYIERQGDTIREVRYKYKYFTYMARDTAYIERVDTVRVPYPVEVIVERNPSLWERVKDKTSTAVAIIAAIIAALIGVKLWRRYRK